MTMTSQTAAQAATPAAPGWIRRVRNWVRALVTYQDRQDAIKALHELNDHALRDIGLVRCYIEKAVHGLAYPDITGFQGEPGALLPAGCDTEARNPLTANYQVGSSAPHAVPDPRPSSE